MVHPCEIVVGTYDLGPAELVAHYSCDIWAVPHFLIPFFITIWFKSWFIGAFFAAFGEQIEYTTLWGLKSFVIFLGTHKGVDLNRDIENLAESYVADIEWMGYLGVFCAWIFYKHFVFPTLIDVYKDFSNRGMLKFLFYAFFLFIVNITLPAALHGIRIGDFRIGILLYPIIHGISILLILWFQPRRTFKGYSLGQKWQFWGFLWLTSLVFNVQNLFDWFFSSHWQVTLIAGIYIILLGGWSIYRWKWPRRIKTTLRFRW